MKPIRIKERSWLARIAAWKLGYHYVALVWGRTIHLHNTTAEDFIKRPSWVRHELKHVEQYERLGYLRFICAYLAEYLRNGYHQNLFEVEARLAEADESLQHRYDLSHYK